MERIVIDDIVRCVADEHGLTMSVTRCIIDSVFQTISDSVANNKQVSITKFGAFTPTRTKAYTGRNPQTQAPVRVPAKTRVRFRAFQGFKDKL